jgi:hypothetical protein
VEPRGYALQWSRPWIALTLLTGFLCEATNPITYDGALGKVLVSIVRVGFIMRAPRGMYEGLLYEVANLVTYHDITSA